MNDDLLEQFIAEARDLLVEAGEDLLALERAPRDRDRINRLFRTVHTLKGSSGLFDLPALTRVLHAGEDLFQAVRERGLALKPEMVDATLAALDQTGKWLDVLERTEALPDDAAPISARLSEALRAHLPAREAAATTPKGPIAASAAAAPPELLRRFARAELAAAAALPGELHLISYTPGETCFFKGEDPLYLALQTPGLEALALEEKSPWENLTTLDPYHCNLAFHALSSASLAELEAKFRYVAAETRIFSFPAAALTAPAPEANGLPAGTRALLAIQAELLECGAPDDEVPGRLAAAATVARNALSACGRVDLQPALAGVKDAAGLAAALRRLLEGGANPLPPPAAPQAPPTDAAPQPEASAAEPAGGTRRALRVDMEKFDLLMNLVGELIVAKNSLPYLARRAETHYNARALGREIRDEYGVIHRIAQELQGAVMAVRMMPVGQVFQRFPRLVRDLARKLGKQVELVITGEATEADKNVIESLFDPLLHMVRNSLDHGIEPAAERRAAGKPETAKLTLAARQEGDQVMLEIIDDGAGIDPAVIRQKAYERGLIDEARLQSLDDQAAIMLIFAPGFSTAENISDVSGRGVGMDVVRAAVEKAGGRISLASTKGIGTTVRLALPLSMAVTRVMTVRQDGRLFGIPMDVVLETVKLPRADVTRIKTAEAFLLRDQIVPLRHLTSLLALPAGEPEAELSVLVVQCGGQILGLGISAFGEVMEVILKPMDGILSRITGYSGTCLLGDGQVLLVLDLRALLQ